MKFNRFKPVFDFVYGFAFASPFGWVSSRRKYLRLACKKRRPCLLCAHPIGLVYAAIQSSRLLNKPQSSWQNCAPAQMRLRRWSATTPGRAPNVSINLSLHLASQMKTTACQVDEPADNAIEQDPTARLTNARLIAIQKSPGHNPIFVNALVQSLSLSLSAALRLFEPFCNHSTVLMLSDFVIPFQCCGKKARLLFFLSFFFFFRINFHWFTFGLLFCFGPKELAASADCHWRIFEFSPSVCRIQWTVKQSEKFSNDER